MNLFRPVLLAVALATVAAAAESQVAALPNVTLQPAETLNLWPGAAPGEPGNIGPEHVLPERPRPFDQITNVTVPTLAVFHPPAAKRTGTGVLVIPGGGLDRLAIEHEGYEIAEWLNAQGLTVFLLKYRVPARSGGPRWKVGVQDAQRAMGIIRARAAEWKVDADAIGSMGFSAGAEINLMLSTYYAEPRQYPRVDAADDLSTRPDFNIAIYGGGFANQTALREDIASRINAKTPPMFVAHAFDDAAMSSIILMGALQRANIPSELHLFAAGAHGFGARDTGLPVAAWRDNCLAWLRWQGYLDAPALRTFARDYAAARERPGTPLPRLTALAPAADFAFAFNAQRRVVRQAVAAGAQVAGYKAAFASRAAQTTAGVKAAAPGVLFKAGRLEASASAPTAIAMKAPLLVETEIGFVIATDIATKLRVPRQALTTVEGIVPVIELPLASPAGTDPRDAVAGNLGSNQFIVGAVVAPKAIVDIDAVAVSLRRGDTRLHDTTGGDVAGGQVATLMALINQLVEQGHILHRGDIVITGALAGAKPAEKGDYHADFGALGKIAFKIE